MVICGIKLTHDGGVAVIDGNRLVFSVETEKINNNPRYSSLTETETIAAILQQHGYGVGDVDHFVIDGWHGLGKYWDGPSVVEVRNGGRRLALEVAPYNEKSLKENILTRYYYGGALSIEGREIAYASYMHSTNHVTSAYCTSPFAQRGESAYVLSWDGGQYPRLYYFDALTGKIANLGHLFLFLGTIYSVFAQYFGPYKKTEEQMAEERRLKEIEGYFGGYSVAGKIMAYIALGQAKPELLDLFAAVHREKQEVSNEFEHNFSREIRRRIGYDQYTDADVLATLHVYLERLLVTSLAQKTAKHRGYRRNLCFVGGCALNIKWNSAIRGSGLFEDMYVPPFPNDSGSAIGAACSEMMYQTGVAALTWNVYQGPAIIENEPNIDWSYTHCSIEELAGLLHRTGEPVVFLNKNAELGPRALGNRSIVAAATHGAMKDKLNEAKKRESYRPVAPICLEEYAPQVFEPGSPDPYMLFEHLVREDWKEKVPAICHLDGTARLQTVNQNDNAEMYQLLSAYHQLSGIPLLCNTSANFNGSGFFPDLYSATKWNKLNYVWCNHKLYYKGRL